MAVWSAWYPDLLVHLPGCPLPIVDHELRRAAQVFFEDSRAWRSKLAALPVMADDEEVSVSTGDDELDVVRVENAWYDGKSIDVFTPDEMANAFSEDWRSHTGTPSAIIQFEPGVVRLYPVPVSNAVTGLVVEASIKPSDSAAGIPDNMRVKFREAMTVGAKSRLMSYANKSWTNFELAAVFASAFDSAISKARLDAAMSYGAGRIRSRPSWC